MYFAITGGIGSGKSFVCRKLEARGIKVYDCDSAAKRLMSQSRELQNSISEIVGQDVFPNGLLDKKTLSEYIISSDDNAKRIDDAVHPAVARDFAESGCEWLESAILFDSGFDRRVHFDFIVCVSAPLDVRIERIMLRDSVEETRARQWISSQLPQEEKEQRSDFVIINDGRHDLDNQIDKLLKEINRIKNK